MNRNKIKENNPSDKHLASAPATQQASPQKDSGRGIGLRAVRQFQRIVLSHYHSHGRPLPWREDSDPYRIMLSEVMLQQTQVDRVVEKFQQFIVAFPDVASLARAPFPQVLQAWLGLGYNRRALALKRAAEHVMEHLNGKFPSTERELLSLPGVGKYTAAAIMAFAYNQPVVVMDTNIRTVFIHHFFEGRDRVRDEEIAELVQETLDGSNPRQWYNALMDYGSMLKKTVLNPGRRSAHYTRQSPFEGSDRQLRARILRLLAGGRSLRKQDILASLAGDAGRIARLLSDLERERFIVRRKGWFSLAEEV